MSSPSAAVNERGAFLRIANISKSFGAHHVLESISLDIERGEFLTLLGESGSGKTTLLRMIAGFEEPTSGQIFLEGQRIDDMPAHKRPVHTVFQNYALFPHKSVFDNVAYGLSVRGVAREEIRSRVEAALTKVRMEAFANRYPRQISGGQKQRVALARALVNQPKVLLLDEPLSALDANLRIDMQRELKSLQRELGITFLFVTHDQSEALAISDRIVLLSRGRVEQCGTPRELYSHPRTAYTASFLGKSNLLQGFVTDGVANCSAFSVPVACANGPVTFSLRPEAIQLASDLHGLPEHNIIHFEATIVGEQFHGASSLLTLHCEDGQSLTALATSLIGDSRTCTFAFRAADCVPVEAENIDAKKKECSSL